MPLEEIKRKESLLRLNRYDKEGFILIPPLYRKYFGKRVRLLFDPEQNLLALQPSNEEEDYATTHWRVWCTEFFKTYDIKTQLVEAAWDQNKKYLVAKIQRE